MALTGQMELEYYQLTPIAIGRVQAGNFPRNMDRTLQGIVGSMARLGGTAEVDELAFSTGIGTPMLKRGLAQLIDLGYVTPVTFQQEQGG